jgi:hypothetical protein
MSLFHGLDMIFTSAGDVSRLRVPVTRFNDLHPAARRRRCWAVAK